LDQLGSSHGSSTGREQNFSKEDRLNVVLKVICSKFDFSKVIAVGRQWLTPVILAAWESAIRRIVVQSQPGQIVHKTPSQKHSTHIVCTYE
jgi:hypothetical protein